MPRQRSPFAKAFAALAKALSELGVDWYLFGAQAALLYGSTRVTADIDATVRLKHVSVEELVDGFKRNGLHLRDATPEFTKQTRVLPLLHRASNIPMDIVLAGPGLEDAFLERAVTRNLNGVAVPVATAEDLIVMKLLAAREKDRADVREILAAHPVDLQQVRATLLMLEAALDQSDLLPLFERLSRGG